MACGTVRLPKGPPRVRRIRSHYPSNEEFLQALGPDGSVTVFTTAGFEAGDELLLELSFQGLPGKMIVRAIGREWHPARPRLKVRARGVAMCSGSEADKLNFLRKVCVGEIKLTARRRHVRLPVLVEVRWKRPGDRDSAAAALSEISEGGAFLLTSEPAEIGESLVVEITPPGSARPLEIAAMVRNSQAGAGLGLEFLARDMGGVHRLREVIRRLVDQ